MACSCLVPLASSGLEQSLYFSFKKQPTNCQLLRNIAQGFRIRPISVSVLLITWVTGVVCFFKRIVLAVQNPTCYITPRTNDATHHSCSAQSQWLSKVVPKSFSAAQALGFHSPPLIFTAEQCSPAALGRREWATLYHLKWRTSTSLLRILG